MSDLPNGWSAASLVEITSKIGSGATPTGGKTSYQTSGIPLIRSMNVHCSGFTEEGLAYLDEDQAKKLDNVIVQPGDVLLNITGASIGRVTIAPSSMNGARVNQHVAIIRLVEGIESKFVSALLSSPSMQRIIAEENYGVTRQALTKLMIEEFRIPVPPLSEQRRIVVKIDSLSAKSKRARDHLDHIPRLVDKYKQAMLAATFSDQARVSWQRGTVEEFVREVLIGLVRSKDQQSDGHGVPYIRMNHFDLEGRWNDFELTFVSVTAEERARYELLSGDVLFNTRNSYELVGKVALWPNGRPGCVYNNNLLRMRFDGRVVPAFATYWMMSPQFRDHLQTVKSATTSVCAIYQRSIMAAPIYVPDVERQHQIVLRIESAFAWIERLASEATSACKLIDHLDQAVLAKAFRGELVPQDSNDEPAGILLERIRGERAAVPTKIKRGPGPRAMCSANCSRS
jgi:type I restriction enzyme S subunit